MQQPTTHLSVVLNDTLANLNAGQPYAAIYRGHYAALSDNSGLYWIDQAGNLQLVNFNVAGYTGFNFTDGSTPSANVASGGTINYTGAGGVEFVSDGASTLTGRLAGSTTATAGQVPVSDGAGGVTFSAPLTIAAGSTPYASINASNELEVTQLLITSPLPSSETSIADFIANDPQAATAGSGDVVILAGTGGTFIHLGTSNGDATDYAQTGNPAGAIQSFTIAADSGSVGTITDGETYTIAGGTGVGTVVAGDTVTVAVDGSLAQIAGVAQPGTAGQYVLQYDQGTDAYTYVAADSFDTSLGDTDQTLTGARSVTQAANALTFGMTGGNVIMTGGDVRVDTSGRGLVLRSPNGTDFRFTVNDLGVLSSATA